MKYRKFAVLFSVVWLLSGCVTMAAPTRPYPAQSHPARLPHYRPAGFWTNEKAVVQVLYYFHKAVTDPNGKTATQKLVVVGTGGVVVDVKGLVLTNNHVIKKEPGQLPAPNSYMVCRVVEGNRDCAAAKVIATDPANDLALLRTDRRFSQSIKFVDDNELVPGDEVYFWGNVFHLLPPSPFFGRYIGRIGPPYFNETKFLVTLPLLLMDINVSPGSSGSPVFDELGRCVGLAVAYFPVSTGPRPLGVIIPSTTVMKFLKKNSPPRRSKK